MLRLIDPGVFTAGLALGLLSVCAFHVAWKRQRPFLYLSSLGFLTAAIPKLLEGGLDLLVWFDFADHGSFVPPFIVHLATFQGYALLLAAVPVALSTHQFLRRGPPNVANGA